MGGRMATTRRSAALNEESRIIGASHTQQTARASSAPGRRYATQGAPPSLSVLTVCGYEMLKCNKETPRLDLRRV